MDRELRLAEQLGRNTRQTAIRLAMKEGLSREEAESMATESFRRINISRHGYGNKARHVGRVQHLG